MYAAIDAQLPPLESFISAAVLADECAGMTAEHVSELGKDPLFTLGAHTVDHPYLTRCTPEETERQISESKTWLERVTGRTCDLFAYPLADFDRNVLEQCRRLGFQQSFGVGWNPSQFATPRVGIYSRSLMPLIVKLWYEGGVPLSTLRFPDHGKAEARLAAVSPKLRSIAGTGRPSPEDRTEAGSESLR